MELFRPVWFGPFDETVLCDFLIGCPHRGSTNQEATSWSKGKNVRFPIFKPSICRQGDETMDEMSPVKTISPHFTKISCDLQISAAKTFRREGKEAQPRKNVVIKASFASDSRQG